MVEIIQVGKPPQVTQGARFRSHKAFCLDERGTMDAMTYILMVTIVGIGMICGLTTLRDQLTQAFGDSAQAIATFNQSYTVNMTFAQLGGGTVVVSYGYVDTVPPPQTPGQPPLGIQICLPATSE